MAATNWSSQLALVTGASGGIGKATCLALADLGCAVAVHYHSSAPVAKALVKDLQAKGVKAAAFQADLRSYDAVRTLYTEVVSAMGSPTILINNAGITLVSGVRSIDEISIEQFEETWRSNCGSAFLLTKLCLPQMAEMNWGRIVFVSSAAGLAGGVVGPHYASSKSALHGLVYWLASAYSKRGITVNGVAPALIQDTAMLPGATEDLEKMVPIGRLGSPGEIADTILWMIKTAYVTRKIVAVDGGMLPH